VLVFVADDGLLVEGVVELLVTTGKKEKNSIIEFRRSNRIPFVVELDGISVVKPVAGAEVVVELCPDAVVLFSTGLTATAVETKPVSCSDEYASFETLDDEYDSVALAVES
jgi:hypothetical protein